MKKLLKISALALAMSALLFSCADPNNNSTNQNASSRKAVSSINDVQVVLDELSYDLGYSFGQAFSELAEDQNFKTDILDKVLDQDGNPKLPINLDLVNKKYSTTGLDLNIEKGKADVTFTSDTTKNTTTYGATTDINGTITFNGSKIKVCDPTNDVDENGNTIKSEPRDNKITSVIGNVTLKATDVSVTLGAENSMPTDISGNISDVTVKANAKFDTGTNGYAGNINLDGNLVAKDLEGLYGTVTTKLNSEDDPVASTINKINAYGKYLTDYENWKNAQLGNGDPNLKGTVEPTEPVYPTDTELAAVYKWIDTLDVTINEKITFTDVNNANPFTLLNVTKLSDLAKIFTPQKISK